MPMSSIDQISIQYIKGVGPAKKKLFLNLGVETVGDLLYLFPRRYEDRRFLTAIRDTRPGEYQTVFARVLGQSARRSWYTRKHVSEVIVGDQSGRLTCVWFNQPYLVHYFKPGVAVVLYGRVDIYKDRLQMISPEYEILDSSDDLGLSTGRIVPVYPLTRGFTQRYVRKVMAAAFDAYGDRLEDVLPVVIRNKYRLLNIQHSIEAIHFPEDMEQQEQGMQRISFEEFFLFQLSVRKRRLQIVGRPGIRHTVTRDLINDFCQMFPFALTSAQHRVIHEIAGDMQKDYPMLRLLQGDVGCGKTVVSLFGCLAAVRNGHQAAIMVPTEVLAEQHFRSMQRMLRGASATPVRLAMLTGSMAKTDKDDLCDRLLNGQIDILIGTHTLISEPLRFKDLSFVVIDEQHKFGVRQRALLSAKGNNPDVLVMTATPIPRTLSLTLFGDLDISIIDEMPDNRGQVVTHVYPMDQADDVYAQVQEFLKQGKQAFVVYPVVQESEVMDVKAAEVMYDEFTKKTFKDFKVGLAHGQMKRSQLNQVMRQFEDRLIDVLVATTVLEVGVDVPTATVMVIEHAERFGLSQLHQLRGRIGRGQDDAVCFLLAEPTTEDAIRRLDAVASTTDGFVLAEKDLEIRGPGHYFGRHQHGVNELRFVNPLKQIDVLELARAEADEIIHQDPRLQIPEHQALLRIIRQRYPGHLDHVEAG